MTTAARTPRLLPPVYFLAFVVLMLILDVVAPLADVIPRPLRHVGTILIVAGALLSLSATLLFRRARTTIKPFRQSSALVRGGPYRVTRNPMYLGMVVALIGVAIRLGALTPFVVVPVFAWIIQTAFIQAEERLLEQTFGAQYAQYRARVRRWL
ncbi:MAG TPA: isoprenylcysteine carboxylmethyltransferase family protein [Methylomirabilota bacterium]|jgi:protein-S-isoprenylcysteine O-methyltransferase Ste14